MNAVVLGGIRISEEGHGAGRGYRARLEALLDSGVSAEEGGANADRDRDPGTGSSVPWDQPDSVNCQTSLLKCSCSSYRIDSPDGEEEGA